MVDISRKTYELTGIETIVDNDGILVLLMILWLKEKHIEEGLHNKNFREITIKYHSDHRKQRYQLVEQPRKQSNRTFIDKKLAVKVLVDCRTTSAQKVRTRLGFKQYDVILTKKQSVLTKIMSSFNEENMQMQYNVIGYRINFFFRNHNLAMEFD